MVGDDIRKLRELLGMTVPQFAQLLGVNPTTAYRWEMASARAVPLDPLHASLLTRLQQSVDARRDKAERSEWGKKLLAAVLIGGTLAGLAVLLAELLPKAAAGTKRRGRT